jgi:GDP-L-fucose synthase
VGGRPGGPFVEFRGDRTIISEEWSNNIVSSATENLDLTAVTYIAGHRGLAGSAIWRRMEQAGFTSLVGRTSADLDLRDRDSTFTFFQELRPKYVIMAAARVGGILANSTYPSEFLSDNLRIQVNVVDAANSVDVERLVFLGSSCIYPKLAPQPIKEEYLMTGHLEPTNDAYAIAKIAGILQIQAARRQYGRRWISAMPTNLYGPGDNFSPQGSHVLPALIRRIWEAKRSSAPSITNWGTGRALREFLHVDDLASAVVYLLAHYDESDPINIGIGRDRSIREISELIAEIVGYDGNVEWDTSKPDGTPRKVLDVGRLRALGWEATISLEDGLRSTIEWYANNYDQVRS